MAGRRGTHFHLILRLDRQVTTTWLWIVVAVIMAGFVLGKLAANNAQIFLVKVIGFLGFLVLMGFGALLARYIFRLHFTSRNRLEFNEEGLFDYASACELGFVPMKSILDVQFLDYLGVQHLAIRFVNNENPILRKPGFAVEVYRWIYGDQLWVPLSFFKVSKIDLESQLIHLDRLIGDRSQQKIRSAKETSALPPEPPVGNWKADENPLATVQGVDIAPPRLETSPGEVPPPLSAMSPEKQRIVSQIEKIKNEVRKNQFDHMVANLYLDHVAMFPALAKNAPETLPSGVSQVRGQQSGSDYEEVRFSYAGQNMIFGLRRDIGRSDEALLSVGVGDRVTMSLKVRVEIGELAPLDLESFRPGPWQKLVEDLYQSIHQLEARRQGRVADITGVSISTVENTETQTSVEDLKDRFGLKD